MAVSDDLINFDLIETHKENIQSLPGGRSARQLVSVLSPMPTFSFSPSGKTTSSPPPQPPTLDETKTLNDAIRTEYETELLSIAESDDPLDIYDRYVKWTLNAYPSAQATPQSQLLPLLERATKAFLSSSSYTHYKNDPRYLKLWLHYIRLFSDAPRETFAFLARHNIGEGLGLFYEEFAAWLEGVGRWGQAGEVYRLGIEREARPVERLVRKYKQFQRRFEARALDQDGDGPSSPALPTVRPALAAKVDPFASSTPRSEADRASSGVGVTVGAPASRSGRSKMAIFSDAADGGTPQPVAAGGGGTETTTTKGWDSIGSLQERKKENAIAARPWAGETLKAGRRAGTEPKMTIFKDQTTRANESRSIPKPHYLDTAAVVNPKTGRAERVFVNLEAVYPIADEPGSEFSLEELRAISRGWSGRNWRPQQPASPLRPISVNIQHSAPDSREAAVRQTEEVEELGVELEQQLVLEDENSSRIQQTEAKETKPPKQKRVKVREIRQEAQTVQTKLESPTGPKLRRKNSAEPTMTFHSKAATDEVYNMFNQSSRHETVRTDSDDEDDDYSVGGESTGTGRISGTTSEFGDEDTIASGGMGDEHTRTGSQPDSVSPWSEFTASKHVPGIRGGKFRNSASEEVTESLSSSQNQTQTTPMSGFDTQAIAAIAGQQIGDLNTQVIAAMAGDFGDDEEEEEGKGKELKTPISPAQPEVMEVPNKPRYVPLPPEDYEPTPLRPFRDLAEVAQNRLPFMTPIVEKTESSLAPSTVFDDNEHFGSKTPSRSNHLPPSTNENSPSRLQIDEFLLNTPSKNSPSPHKRKLGDEAADIQALISSPQKLKSKFGAHPTASSRKNIQPFAVPQPALVKSSTTNGTNGVANATHSKGPIIHDLQCNPVDPSIREQILTSIHPALSSYPGFFDRSSQRCGKYAQIQTYTRKLASTKVKGSPRKGQSDKTLTQAVQPLLDLDGSSRVYAVKREIGKGAFAPVYLVDSHDRDDDGGDVELALVSHHQTNAQDKRSSLEAIKTEEPPSAWEFHILRLLRRRLGSMSRTMQSIILAHECHIFADECYLVLEYRNQGTLLDLVNAIKEENRRAGKADAGLDEALAMFLSVELLRTVEQCHGVGVMHGDLKADNCLVRFEDGELLETYQRDGSCGWESKGMTLIDFGRGIDVRAFRAEVKFVADWSAGAQDCAEVRECRPWTWQIDYFGCAGVMHSLLFGRYIETALVSGNGSGSGSGSGGGGGGLGEKKEWRLKESFKRYWAQGVWGEVFGLLLNPALVVAGGEWKRELRRVRGVMEGWLEEEGERKGLRASIRRVEGVVNARRK